MTEQEAIDKLNNLSKGDNEALHVAADNILVEFLVSNGYKEIAVVYDKISDTFWYA